MTDLHTGPKWGQRGKEGKRHLDVVWDCLHCKRSLKSNLRIRDITIETSRGPKKHILISGFLTACNRAVRRLA